LFTHFSFVSFGAVPLAVDMNSTQARNLLLIFNETIDCWAANLAQSRGGEAGGLASWQLGMLLL
jgi:hypothetical protein